MVDHSLFQRVRFGNVFPGNDIDAHFKAEERDRGIPVFAESMGTADRTGLVIEIELPVPVAVPSASHIPEVRKLGMTELTNRLRDILMQNQSLLEVLSLDRKILEKPPNWNLPVQEELFSPLLL